MLYYHILIWIMKLFQSLDYDNYDDFLTCQLHIFTKKWFHYFEGYLMMKVSLG